MDLVTFTEEILNRKLYFLSSDDWAVVERTRTEHLCYTKCPSLANLVSIKGSITVYGYIDMGEVNNYS